MKKRIYWIYTGKTLLTGVYLYPGASDGDVIGKAVAENARVPLRHGIYTPHEWDLMLRTATVKRGN